MKFVLGLSARAGAVFGDPGAFFLQQGFALGGVQYGEPLRGYAEFSITPRGFDPDAEQFNATSSRASFGNAFFTMTAELGLRINQQLYLERLLRRGQQLARAREFNPTRLFRGAGFGVSVVTPLGPLGLDWAYGFDRLVPRSAHGPAPAGPEVAAALPARQHELLSASALEASPSLSTPLLHPRSRSSSNAFYVPCGAVRIVLGLTASPHPPARRPR